MVREHVEKLDDVFLKLSLLCFTMQSALKEMTNEKAKVLICTSGSPTYLNQL
jgi:hypothetical protein